MSELSCPYRFNERKDQGDVIATCGLLQHTMGVQDSRICDVTIDACKACVAATPLTGRFINSVFPSILNNACEQFLQSDSTQSNQTQRISTLHRITEQTIVQEASTLLNPPAACDAVIYCTDSSTITRQSIDSLLGQSDASVYVHLIVGNQAARSLVDEYRDTWNVQSYALTDCESLFDGVQQIAP